MYWKIAYEMVDTDTLRSRLTVTPTGRPTTTTTQLLSEWEKFLG